MLSFILTQCRLTEHRSALRTTCRPACRCPGRYNCHGLIRDLILKRCSFHHRPLTEAQPNRDAEILGRLGLRVTRAPKFGSEGPVADPDATRVGGSYLDFLPWNLTTGLDPLLGFHQAQRG